MTDREEPIYCPLCGNSDPYVEHYELLGWGVYCDFCNCQIAGYRTREGAVKQWNHRFTPEKKRGVDHE